MNNKNIPELIAPGWSYNKAMVAAMNWADSIYLWVPFTSLRMRQNKVRTFDELKKTITDLKTLGKKAFLTMNIFPRDIDIKVFESVVEKISDMWADAIIFSDPWTYNIIKRYLPDTRLHLSTQTNVLNTEAIKFWQGLGVSRIVLARELTLKEIENMKKQVPWMELEIFIHWAMCVTYSWRCLMWEYFSWRDGNKWECSHVCRYKFKVYLEEEKRPWKFYEMGQDEEGWTYMMSSKDLCTIERLAEIIPHVDWLKIEWRSKWELYVWAVTKSYRHVLDSIVNWTPIDDKIKNMVYEIPHRPYWDWFLFNDIKSAPDGEEEITNQNLNSISFETAWPVIDKKYFWLVLPEFVEKNWKKYFEFIPKELIVPWDKLSYFSPLYMWDLSVSSILTEDLTDSEKADCNMKKCYVNFDKDVKWWEVLYK